MNELDAACDRLKGFVCRNAFTQTGDELIVALDQREVIRGPHIMDDASGDGAGAGANLKNAATLHVGKSLRDCRVRVFATANLRSERLATWASPSRTNR